MTTNSFDTALHRGDRVRDAVILNTAGTVDRVYTDQPRSGGEPLTWIDVIWDDDPTGCPEPTLPSEITLLDS